MKLKTAIEILDYHQEWRQGKREHMAHEPKKLTEALDVVLEQVKKLNIHNVIVTLPNNDEVIKKAWNYGDKCTGDSFNKFMCDGAYKEGANWIIGLINKDKQGN